MRYTLTLLATFLLLTNIAEGKSSLVGTTESLHRQNDRADKEGMVRIKNDSELEVLKASGTLVRIPPLVKIDPRLADKWHWCRPAAASFLGDIGYEFEEGFRKQLQVNSAVRTATRQLELIPENGNAVPVSGKRSSLHLTGSTVDIAKIGLTTAELAWLRERLLFLENLDVIEATEEHQQLVFHVMVFDRYLAPLQRAQ